MAENQKDPDFTGWASKHGLRCSDGRTIMPGAFKHMDKKKVPLVFMHRQTTSENLLGHAILSDRAFGTYAEGYFNNTQRAQDMREAVRHGDLDSLSVYANNLNERKLRGGREVYHGDIVELSLVIAGANPGAKIDFVNMKHADDADIEDEEVILHTGLYINQTYEGDSDVTTDTTDDTLSHAVDTATELDQETLDSIFASMSEKQRNAALYVAGASYEAGVESVDKDADAEVETGGEAAQSATDTTDETNQEGLLAHMDNNISKKEGALMHRNVFDQTDASTQSESSSTRTATLSHADQRNFLDEARRKGGLLSSFVESGESTLSHADYGVDGIGQLFPDYKMDGDPALISRRVEWVDVVLKGVKKQPFAKIKSLTFDITAQEARAKGYIKGTEKKDEVVKLLKRTTGPTTVYKKQKLDRDDILDITDFDIVAWLKWEIRYMLDEEIARAILIGDGRSSSNPDKIKDPEGAASGDGIRSVLHDADLYAIKKALPANTNAETRIEEITRARSEYRGSGTPTFFTSDAELTDMLLLKDKVGRRLYATEAELASVLRVKNIVSVEVFEEEESLLGIVLNLLDYTVGANKGGELTFFSDFDIDFNQEKYLMETRISGALNKPKSAIVFSRQSGTAVSSVTAPSFNGATNTITIPTVTGVIYTVNDEAVTGNVVIDEDTTVEAEATTGYYIPAGTTRTWSYQFTE